MCIRDSATAARLREMKLNTRAEKLLWQMEQPEIQSLSFEEDVYKRQVTRRS